LLGPTQPGQKTYLDIEFERLKSESIRYNKEKEGIKTEAENVAKDNALANRRANQFSLSVVFFQIGIMLSSVSALLKRKEMWVIGLIFGFIAAVYLGNGFLLLF